MFLVSSSPQGGTDQTASTPEPYRTWPATRPHGELRSAHRHRGTAAQAPTVAIGKGGRDGLRSPDHKLFTGLSTKLRRGVAPSQVDHVCRREDLADLVAAGTTLTPEQDAARLSVRRIGVQSIEACYGRSRHEGGGRGKRCCGESRWAGVGMADKGRDTWLRIRL